MVALPEALPKALPERAKPWFPNSQPSRERVERKRCANCFVARLARHCPPPGPAGRQTCWQGILSATKVGGPCAQTGLLGLLGLLGHFTFRGLRQQHHDVGQGGVVVPHQDQSPRVADGCMHVHVLDGAGCAIYQ